MLRMLWSVKGGAGVSVVAAALAQRCALDGPTVLVDLAGDQPAVLGLADPGPGVTEWLHTAERSAEALGRLALDVSRNWTLVPRGRGAVPDLVDRGGRGGGDLLARRDGRRGCRAPASR